MFDVDIVKEENRHTFEDMESLGAQVVVPLFTRSLFEVLLLLIFLIAFLYVILFFFFLNSLDSFASNWAQDLALLLICIFGRGMGSGPGIIFLLGRCCWFSLNYLESAKSTR